MPQFYSKDGTVGSWGTEAPDDYDFSGDSQGFFPITRLRQQYLDYLAAKVQEYEEQKQSRHYYHGSQWTPEDIRILRARRQPIITYNCTGRKIDQIVGLLQRLRQDPKAYPIHPRNAEGAEVASHCVRYVLESNDWEFLDPWCAGQAAIEGIGGVELKLIEGDHGDPDIGIDVVFGDDFFYDPRSYKGDFSDARYLGIAKWLDVEEAIELFPDREDELRTLMVETGFDLTTHADREFKWIYVNEKRLRLVEHWYKHNGKWFWCFYCSMILLDQGPSPFYDDRHQSMPRFMMFSASVDHDGDRYGFARNLKGPQDELNQRRSKALHISNTRRIIAQKGAVDDVETARREYARPDGWIEVNRGFEMPQTEQKAEDLEAHLSLMQDARNEIDGFANINPGQLTGDTPDEHSGVALDLIQKAGIAELGAFLRNYKAWKKRLYRTVWAMVQRHWRAERWIRVADNLGVAQFVQINGLRINEWGQPEIANQVGSLHVDIRLDDGPNVANLMQDGYDVLKQDPNVPWQLKLFFMPIPETMKKQAQQYLAQSQQNAPPDPKVALEQAKIQSNQQIEQARLIAEKQRHDQELEFQARKSAAEMELERQRAAVQLQIEREKLEIHREKTAHDVHMNQQKIAHDAMLSREKTGHELQLTREKSHHEISMSEKKLEHDKQRALVKPQKPERDEELHGNIKELIRLMKAPRKRTLHRDPKTGKPTHAIDEIAG